MTATIKRDINEPFTQSVSMSAAPTDAFDLGLRIGSIIDKVNTHDADKDDIEVLLRAVAANPSIIDKVIDRLDY